MKRRPSTPNRDMICEINEDCEGGILFLLDEFDEAIIGTATVAGYSIPAVVYDHDRLILSVIEESKKDFPDDTEEYLYSVAVDYVDNELPRSFSYSQQSRSPLPIIYHGIC